LLSSSALAAHCASAAALASVVEAASVMTCGPSLPAPDLAMKSVADACPWPMPELLLLLLLLLRSWCVPAGGRGTLHGLWTVCRLVALESVLKGNPKWRACPGAASAETQMAIVIHSCFIKAAIVGCGELWSSGKIFNHFSVFSGLMRMIKGKKFSEKAFKKGKKGLMRIHPLSDS